VTTPLLVLGYLVLGVLLASASVALKFWTDDVINSRAVLATMVLLWPLLIGAGLLLFLGSQLGRIVQIIGRGGDKDDDGG
jgi:hypothetical protein